MRRGELEDEWVRRLVLRERERFFGEPHRLAERVGGERTASRFFQVIRGLHGLAPMPAKPGQRGKNLHGQYYEAYPNHAVELAKPLDAELKQRWLALARSLGLNTATLEKQTTRRDFIRRAFVAAGN